MRTQAAAGRGRHPWVAVGLVAHATGLGLGHPLLATGPNLVGVDAP